MGDIQSRRAPHGNGRDGRKSSSRRRTGRGIGWRCCAHSVDSCIFVRKGGSNAFRGQRPSSCDVHWHESLRAPAPRTTHRCDEKEGGRACELLGGDMFSSLVSRNWRKQPRELPKTGVTSKNRSAVVATIMLPHSLVPKHSHLPQ